ncbi:hypothetical protein [Mycolicibacterium hodleri]|uniref:Luciferase-like domain-containing protein n=1 Tax=Mycolicibacterium hodleri TaxID=49897 RepID=A0A502E602_9MYCO|nr:hypothetical protein [Mycolicibacterium hodleri]TPG33083.1 hypothetical protein EAH80_16955 [Mycolicibacterium hodleri]
MIGGTGPRMLEVVRRHANWWNLPGGMLNRLPGKGSDPDVVGDESKRRWGHLGSGLVCGNAEHLIEHFDGLRRQGAQRLYVWFADGARPESVEEFGSTVIARFPADVRCRSGA